MSKWISVYRNKQRRKQDETWACTGCGSRYSGDHDHHPPNHLCTCECQHGKLVSDAYRDGWERIWGKKD